MQRQNSCYCPAVRSRLRQAILWAALLIATVPSLWSAEQVTGTTGAPRYKARINFRQMAQFGASSPLTNRPPKNTFPLLPLRGTNDTSGDSGSPETAPSSAQPESLATAQGLAAVIQSPTPASSFSALDDSYLFVNPPDPAGAVGPNHILTAANSQLRVQDRQGNNLVTMDLDTFWTPVGFPGAVMPKIIYNPYDNRWIVAAVSAPPPAQFTNFFFFSSVLLAVSETSDPSGNWIMFRQIVDDTRALFFAEPTIGFNKNWIVISVNAYDNSGGFASF